MAEIAGFFIRVPALSSSSSFITFPWRFRRSAAAAAAAAVPLRVVSELVVES